MEHAADAYLQLKDEDILFGFRSRGGLTPVEGRPLTGWCQVDSAVVFGQWLSGLSRLSLATGRAELGQKAIRLMEGWAETLGPDSSSALDHYGFDKTLCGLVDVAQYLGDERALTLARTVSAWASSALSRENLPAQAASQDLHSGRVPEWYTLAENLYRAYLLSGDDFFRSFAQEWHYEHYWGKFEVSPAPEDAWGVHAYSHLNSFCSAAAAYEVEGEPRLLHIIRNAYTFFTTTQCFASGGFGPAERIQPEGGLANSLDHRMDSFEAPCGSWAALKLAKYLIRFTGAAEAGDWVERLLYNGIGASLGMEPDGRHFYYADYRVSGSIKAHNRDTFACCSGSYLQAVADYVDQIFFSSVGTLAICQFVPSRLTTTINSSDVQVEVQADLPGDPLVTITVASSAPARWALRVRQPLWANGPIEVTVDGRPAGAVSFDGWLVLDRTWSGTATVQVALNPSWHWSPIDNTQPNRAAVLLGPAVYVLDAWRHEPVPGRPRPTGPADNHGSYAIEGEGNQPYEARLQMYRDLPANWSHRMYFDSRGVPFYPAH